MAYRRPEISRSWQSGFENSLKTEINGWGMLLLLRCCTNKKLTYHWHRLFKPAPVKVRGGQNKTLRTHSAKRIATMFPAEANVVEYLNRHENDQRPIRAVTETTAESNIAWVRLNIMIVSYCINQDYCHRQIMFSKPTN